MAELDKFRKKIRKEIEKTFVVDEDSDFPVHERYTKETNVLTMKKKVKKCCD